ncbi:MAG: hypothetical protein HY847_00300 [Betaproteobacteria bacterium]|nr:hypothetical protein [Betaproteobacteria bacterium]
MTRIYLYQNRIGQAPSWPPLRQTFLGLGCVLKDFYFVTEEPTDADYLLSIADGTIPVCKYNVPRSRRIVVLMENPAIWTPPQSYLNYFGIVLSPTMIPVPEETRLVLTQPAVSWFYGLKFRTDRGLSHEPVLEDYLQLEDLAILPLPQKTRLLSCVVSSKSGTWGHNWRIEMANALKAHFGEQIDMFGFGWNPIADKRDAIDPYLHTIVIENECRENYWTEKLSDAIIGYSQPIYAGAPNVRSYFTHDFPILEYGISSDEFVTSVSHMLESGPAVVALYERRNQILYEHNLFYHVARLIEHEVI